MRSLLFFYSLFLSVLAVKACEIRFTFSDGLDSNELKAKMESNVAILLNEINSACSENSALQITQYLKSQLNEFKPQELTIDVMLFFKFHGELRNEKSSYRGRWLFSC